MNQQEVLALKKKREQAFLRQKAEFDKDNEAIERVLMMLSDTSSDTVKDTSSLAPISLEPEAGVEKEATTKRVRGLKQSAISVLNDLALTFTKNDVASKIETRFEKFKDKISNDSLRGVMLGLVVDGYIEVVEKASGTKPAIYKLRKHVEAATPILTETSNASSVS